MKRIFDNTTRRWGYDGWALCTPDTNHPLAWSFSTTREEVRELVAERLDGLFAGYPIRKVKVELKLV